MPRPSINALPLGCNGYMGHPVHATWYGVADDPYVRVTETYRNEDGVLYVDRKVQTRAPLEQITLSLHMGEPVQVGER